jgi:hypothetical protein
MSGAESAHAVRSVSSKIKVACFCVFLRVSACFCVFLRVSACFCVFLRVSALYHSSTVFVSHAAEQHRDEMRLTKPDEDYNTSAENNDIFLNESI